MVRRLIGRFGVLAIVAAMLPLSTDPGPALAAAAAQTRPAGQVRTLPPDVVAAGLTAQGELARTVGRATVERIQVSARLRAAHPQVPATVWRVTLAGRYPPRALRYVVLAGGRPVGFGIPSTNETGLRTITADGSVTTGAISARYEGAGLATPPSTQDMSAAPPATGTTPDPSAQGPYQVTRAVYNLGNQVFQPQGLGGKVELAGDVHYPTDLSGGPYPLVLFMHGNHSSCFKGQQAGYEWPCSAGWKPLPNYAGYDYIAARLASWGFIVVSVSANGVNVLGNNVADTGMRQRGEVLEKHIDLWRKWSTAGGRPFGSTFVGAADLTRIGTMGHSRGGEGAVWNVLVDRRRPHPYGIDAVLALAPVDFTRATITEVPFDVMLPYCDGDVSDLQGIHFFDDSRYAVPADDTPKSTVTVYGANHNFFNTVWSPSGGYPGASDDASWVKCARKLTETDERAVGQTYIVSFFRRYIGADQSLDPMWTGAVRPDVPTRTLLSYQAPASLRLDIDRFTGASQLEQGELGPVVPHGMSSYGWCGDIGSSPCLPGQLSGIDIHLSYPSWLTGEQLPGLAQAVLGWSGPNAELDFAIPPPSADVTGFDAFQFRGALNPAYDANTGVAYQDLTVTLVDGSGARADVAASEVGNDALIFPVGRLDRYGSVHYIVNQVRFPLRRFGGIDLQDIRAVELHFDRVPVGVVDIADVAFSAGSS